jgi:arsenic resistance protein ArsH
LLCYRECQTGSQSFNAVAWFTRAGALDAHGDHSDQSSVAKAYQEFGKTAEIKSPYYERLVDVMEEQHNSTLLVRDRRDYAWAATAGSGCKQILTTVVRVLWTALTTEHERQ